MERGLGGQFFRGLLRQGGHGGVSLCDRLSHRETATATYTPTIPAAGFYPVYTWALSSSNRTNQLYRINHTGGQSLVRVCRTTW